MKKLRPHQVSASKETLAILKKFGVVYLAGEPRTGKTLTALHTMDTYLKGRGVVLIVTSKKAISSIENDFDEYPVGIEVAIVNYESAHKVDFKVNGLILDEVHRLSKFPKPGKGAKLLKEKFAGLPTILMSGTPSPESFSQLFHQFWVTGKGPWSEYKSFYKWAKDKINIKKRYIGMGSQVNDYSEALPGVMKEFKKYRISMSQVEAGFKGKVLEEVHLIKTPKLLMDMVISLRRKGIYEKGPIELMSDTAGKLSSYVHQITSGTVIATDGNAYIIDRFKANYIKDTFKGKKAIFFIFKAEGELLKKVFPKWTSDPDEFRDSKDLTFICQVRSGQEGTNLSSAKHLIFYNISFSAVSYWQARARTQTWEGGDKTIHWIFSASGIEDGIYEAVSKKKDYTLKHFTKYARALQTKTNR